MTQEKTWTVLEVLRFSQDYLAQRNVPEPRLSSEVLLSHVLSIPRIRLYTDHDRPLEPEELAAFRKLLLRRADREPAAYITGRREFWSLDLAVGPDVLIPRPETEHLVEEALKRLPPREETDRPLKVLDLGAGSGAVILALASERPGHFYAATDASLAALGLARENARRLLPDADILWVCGHWFAPFAPNASFDLIVSNPPYIDTAVLRALEPEVSRFEPALAIDGGPGGMDAIRAIMRAAPGHLASGGVLALEMGHDQADAVKALAREIPGLGEPAIVCDYAGLPRVAVMERQG
ncbi:MAG: peptide chain release factor N(5)-glutamine methyltransferase [Deltaproteobacteria bacterium]|nr:peptide chain release factor N(5)-glutamine methyltransferase [Deltaproteobacteria bacterium]